jgi:hypothetical protein
MGGLGRHLNDRQREGSVILPAEVVTNRADGDVDVKIRHTGKQVRASRGNSEGTYTPGQVVQLSRTDASGMTSNTGWVIIGPPPSNMRGASKSARLDETSRGDGAAVTLIVPNPAPIVAGGDPVTVQLYGAFAGVRSVSFGTHDLSNDIAPVATPTQITLQVRASSSAIPGAYDLLLDGVVVAPGLFKVSVPVTPPAHFLALLAFDSGAPVVVLLDASTLAHYATVAMPSGETDVVDLNVAQLSGSMVVSLYVRGSTTLLLIGSDGAIRTQFTGLSPAPSPQSMGPFGADKWIFGASGAIAQCTEFGGEFGIQGWFGTGDHPVACDFCERTWCVDGTAVYKYNFSGIGIEDTLALADAVAIASEQVPGTPAFVYVGAGNVVHQVATVPLVLVTASADLGASFDGTQIRNFGGDFFGCVGATGGADSKVFKLHTSDMSITPVSIPQGPQGIGFGAGNLYVCDSSGGITVIDPISMSGAVRTVVWPSAISRVCYF